MAYIAIIACSNGLGHTKRSLTLGNELRARGNIVRLFAPNNYVKRLAKIDFSCDSGFELVDFNTQTSIGALRSNFRLADQWMSTLPDLDVYDLVISDNLPEVLERRRDTVLSGHFFWHLSLNDIAPEYLARCEYLMAKIRPRIISTKLLLGDKIKDLGECYPVGLFGTRHETKLSKSDVLITSGLGAEWRDEYQTFVKSLASGPPPPFKRVHVEPSLLPLHKPHWMVPAIYDQAMYDALLAIVCRPGAGTVTDGLLSGARLFCFYESQNGEMAHNASMIELNGVGTDGTDIETAYKLASAFSNSPNKHKNHAVALAAIVDNGHKEAADLIQGWTN